MFSRIIGRRDPAASNPFEAVAKVLQEKKILAGCAAAALALYPQAVVCGALFAAAIHAINEKRIWAQGSQTEALFGLHLTSITQIASRSPNLADLVILMALTSVNALSSLPAFWMGIVLCTCVWNAVKNQE